MNRKGRKENSMHVNYTIREIEIGKTNMELVDRNSRLMQDILVH